MAECFPSEKQTYIGWLVRMACYAQIQGKSLEYVKRGESGNKRVQAFCGSCGTGLYATSAGEGPRVYGLRVGTTHQRDQLAPRRQA